jgi:hypothetical protein
MRRLFVIIAPVILILGLGMAAAADSGRAPCKAPPVPFEESSLIVETNATDGDAGIQIFLDHDPWRSVAFHTPDGKRLLDVKTRGVLNDYGLTELFSESSEPPFTELPLEEFKKLWPEGDYRYTGCTLEGEALSSTVTLTHDLPAGSEILSPEADSIVSADGVVIRWAPVTEPAGIEIVAYQVLVVDESEDPKKVFSADLPATATELSVSPQFVQPGVEYKVEVLAIEVSGNQTLSEILFTAA